MPPKRKASYATRMAQRRRVEANNPHPSQLTVRPAAGETPQISTRSNPPLAQGERRVNAAWLENLGNTIAAAVQKSWQDTGISVTNPPTPSQPEVQFTPVAPQANNAVSHTHDGSSMTQTPVQAAIQQVTSNLVDGTKQPPISKNSFVSVAVPLSHRVSDKVKKKKTDLG